MHHTLQGHGHWVNTMALNTDYALRTGAFDPGDRTLEHVGVTKMNGKGLGLGGILLHCTIFFC